VIGTQGIVKGFEFNILDYGHDNTKCLFDMINFANLFLLLFMGSTALFRTIHESHYTILTNFFTFTYSTFNKKFSISEK